MALTKGASMCKRLPAVWGLFIVLSVVGGSAEPAGKVLKETWDAVFLEDSQVGHVHGLYREVQKDDQKLIEASTEMEMNLVRNGQPLQMNFSIADHETADGKV